MSKYYIKMTNKHTNIVKYKRYKCIDGFSTNKEECWKFSKQGALGIIERLKKEYYRNLDKLEFELEPVEEV